MATLPLLWPTGDSSVGSWTDNAGGTTNIYLKIDEGITNAVDTNDYVNAPTDTNNADYKVAIADMPADFKSMLTGGLNVRYALSASPPSSNKDTYGISAVIMAADGTTVLAAAAAGGTFTSIVSTTTMSTSYSNSGVVSFAYINTGATPAQWNGAILTLRQTYSATGGKDGHNVRVSAVEFSGTYNRAIVMSGTVQTYAETGTNLTGQKWARKFTAAVQTYSESGINLTKLQWARKFTAAVQTYSETGVNLTKLVRSWLSLTAIVQTYTESGVNLTKLVKSWLSLAAAVRDYGITSVDLSASLWKRLLAVTVQTCSETGINLTGYSRTYRLGLAVQTYTESGIDLALLSLGRGLTSATQTYAVTGTNLVKYDRTYRATGIIQTYALAGSAYLEEFLTVSSATLLLNLQAGGRVDKDTTPFEGSGLITQSGNTISGDVWTAFDYEVVVGDRIASQDLSIDGNILGIGWDGMSLTVDSSATVTTPKSYDIYPQQNTARVNAWNDQSGNANDFTAAGTARPSWEIYRNFPQIRFDEFDDVLTSGDFADNGSELCIFAVFTSGAAGRSLEILGKYDSVNSSGPFWVLYSDNANEGDFGVGDITASGRGNLELEQRYIVTGRYQSPSIIDYYLNGSKQDTTYDSYGSFSYSANHNNVFMGLWSRIQVSCILIFSPFPNEEDRIAITEWLARKYGVLINFQRNVTVNRCMQAVNRASTW